MVEWRQFIHSIDRPISPGELLQKLNIFKHKTLIYYELTHYEYLERLNEWLEVVKNEAKLEDVINENYIVHTSNWIEHLTTKH